MPTHRVGIKTQSYAKCLDSVWYTVKIKSIDSYDNGLYYDIVITS